MRRKPEDRWMSGIDLETHFAKQDEQEPSLIHSVNGY